MLPFSFCLAVVIQTYNENTPILIGINLMRLRRHYRCCVAAAADAARWQIVQINLVYHHF